jgi:hypothetical protein
VAHNKELTFFLNFSPKSQEKSKSFKTTSQMKNLMKNMEVQNIVTLSLKVDPAVLNLSTQKQVSAKYHLLIFGYLRMKKLPNLTVPTYIPASF